MIESTIKTLMEEVKHIQEKSQHLQDENDALKLQLIELKKDYTRELVDMKTLYKLQHKQHVKKYQDKIEQLVGKLKRFQGGLDAARDIGKVDDDPSNHDKGSGDANSKINSRHSDMKKPLHTTTPQLQSQVTPKLDPEVRGIRDILQVKNEQPPPPQNAKQFMEKLHDKPIIPDLTKYELSSQLTASGKPKVKTTEFIPGLPFSQYENPNLIPTQYSSDSEIVEDEHYAISPVKETVESPRTSQVFKSSPVKPNIDIFNDADDDLDPNNLHDKGYQSDEGTRELIGTVDDKENRYPNKRQKLKGEYDIPYEDIEKTIFIKTTPLFERHWMKRYYENKFIKQPDFKINLTINPITRIPWTIHDFTRKFEVSETPPFFYIKDNTSQEERIKKLKFKNDLKKLIKLRLNQIFTNENKFFYDILNDYVEAGRYEIDETVLN